MALLTQTLRIHDTEEVQAPQQELALGGFTIVTRKRGRQPSPPGSTKEPFLKQGPGRPSFMEMAQRDATQSMLQLGIGSPKVGHREISKESDTDMDNPIYTQDEKL